VPPCCLSFALSGCVGAAAVIFGTVERMIAWRYLRSRRQEGFVSVIALFSLLGVALGVATLIVTMSVMNGFRADLLARILGFTGHISVYGAHGPLPDFDAMAAEIRGLPEVTAVRPVADGQVMASAKGHSAGALVRGIRAEDLGAQTLIASHLSPGYRFDGDTVLLGSGLARKLDVVPGDRVSLLSPNGQATAFGTMPRVKSYRVGGTFEVGEFDYDGGYIFMPLAAAQLFFALADRATSLEVFVRDPDRVAATDQAIRSHSRGTLIPYDWQQRNASYFAAVETERNVMFIILSLIILVAAFNIISSMIMMVKDKGRDIAILRTMGATRGMILRIFMLSGASVGSLGTALGCALGVALAANLQAVREAIQGVIGVDLFSAAIYHLTQIPERIDPLEVAVVLAMAFGLSFLATLYPSWRAARLDPVEALRYE
jgi:lipoprotein-releasing system permease protein